MSGSMRMHSRSVIRTVCRSDCRRRSRDAEKQSAVSAEVREQKVNYWNRVNAGEVFLDRWAPVQTDLSSRAWNSVSVVSAWVLPSGSAADGFHLEDGSITAVIRARTAPVDRSVPGPGARSAAGRSRPCAGNVRYRRSARVRPRASVPVAPGPAMNRSARRIFCQW